MSPIVLPVVARFLPVYSSDFDETSITEGVANHTIVSPKIPLEPAFNFTEIKILYHSNYCKALAFT